jgi:DNA modification methylase
VTNAAARAAQKRLDNERDQLAKYLNKYTAGNCIELMKHLPEGYVDLTVVDPPYNIGEDYDYYHDKRDVDEYLHWASDWTRGIYRALKPTGTFWLVINDALVSEMDMLCKGIGFYKRSHVIWYYTFGQNSSKKLTPSHVHLLYYVKHPDKFTFNPEKVKVPSARSLVYKDKRATPGGRLPDDTWILRPQWFPGAFLSGEDTWTMTRVCGTFKEKSTTPNQLPERLLARPIELCSNPGDIVMDNFAGSASTLTTAKKLGRRYIGMDLSKNYADAGTLRLESVNQGDPLAGAPQQGDSDDHAGSSGSTKTRRSRSRAS